MDAFISLHGFTHLRKITPGEKSIKTYETASCWSQIQVYFVCKYMPLTRVNFICKREYLTHYVLKWKTLFVVKIPFVLVLVSLWYFLPENFSTQWRDSFQTCRDISLEHLKELVWFWWPWNLFTGITADLFLFCCFVFFKLYLAFLKCLLLGDLCFFWKRVQLPYTCNIHFFHFKLSSLIICIVSFKYLMFVIWSYFIFRCVKFSLNDQNCILFFSRSYHR